VRATFANEIHRARDAANQGRAAALLLVFLLLAGCASVRVTPAKLAASALQSTNHSEALSDLARWQEAVGLCNAFLDSPYRQTLPKGRLRLTPEGMEFVTDGRVLPVRVNCTRGGDLVVRVSKLLAQERSDGFAVGLTPPRGNRLLDNSLFHQANGQPLPSDAMAVLILHEITHCYYHLGTVSFWKAVRYYGEAVLLFRYRNHSMERLPYQTSKEFWTFYRNGEPRSATGRD
jgi:hypothetical protein